jgi:hypothetical protein
MRKVSVHNSLAPKNFYVVIRISPLLRSSIPKKEKKDENEG